jgi:hypothetical protein
MTVPCTGIGIAPVLLAITLPVVDIIPMAFTEVGEYDIGFGVFESLVYPSILRTADTSVSYPFVVFAGADTTGSHVGFSVRAGH